MVLYNFKAIGVVPTASDFVDIVLSKTQRGTPTVVHKGWAITRIRQFYTRKVQHARSISCTAGGMCLATSLGAAERQGSTASTCLPMFVLGTLLNTGEQAGAVVTRARVLLLLQVKFAQQNWHDRLTVILDDFPKVRGFASALTLSLSLPLAACIQCF